MKNLKILGFIAILALIAFAFIACSTDDTCTCPPGTIRLVGEAPCGGSGCTCETGVVGVRVQGIAVTNRSGVADFDFIITNVVEEAISWLSSAELTKVKNNVREIRLQSGYGTGSTSGGVITIRENTDAGTLYNQFYDNYLTTVIQSDNIIKLAYFITLAIVDKT